MTLPMYFRDNGSDRGNLDVGDTITVASFNPMSYFSPSSVFSLSSLLPSYLVSAASPPEQQAKSSEPRLEREESEESGKCPGTEQVSSHSADTPAEAKYNSELNNQHSKVFLFTSYFFLTNNDDRLKWKMSSFLKKTLRLNWMRRRPQNVISSHLHSRKSRQCWRRISNRQ